MRSLQELELDSVALELIGVFVCSCTWRQSLEARKLADTYITHTWVNEQGALAIGAPDVLLCCCLVDAKHLVVAAHAQGCVRWCT